MCEVDGPRKTSGAGKASYGILRFTLGRSDLSTILRLLSQNRSVIFVHPVLIVVNVLLSCVLFPFKFFEQLRFGRAIAGTDIDKPPLFILGHYRSGTTHLFNLLSQDDRYGYINSVKAALPGAYITLDKFVRNSFSLFSSGSRPCDSMTVAADSAQEDEYAMTHQSPHSFLHVLTFPKNFRSYIQKYTLFNDIEKTELHEWKSSYLYLLRKLTFSEGGRRLLIKNPEHTGRLPFIADMFPGSQYIHIVRNPYDVYVSSIYLYKSLFPHTALQAVSDDDIRELVITRYQLMMKSYIDSCHLIPEGDLVELRFEELELNPAGVVRRAYASLGIEISESFSTSLQLYINSVQDYKKNTYSMSDTEIELVNREWAFAFEYWNYPIICSVIPLNQCGQAENVFG